MTSTQLKPLKKSFLALLLTLTGTAFTTSAQEGTDPGFEVAARSDRSDRGFIDSRVEMTMILKNAAGHKTTRTLELRTLEVPNESVGDKSLIIFHTPRDIDGTALLSHAKILDPDDQWLYLPSLKRVKRISSVNKSGPFVGSEFAFEDLTGQELNKYDYRLLGTEACGELTCDRVERTPRYEYSGYTRQIAWIDRKVYQFRRIDYYDRRNERIKTQSFDDYRQYGDVWRAQRIHMQNHLNGKSTELLFDEWQLGTGQGDGDFRKGVLKRLR
ncbi:MAG: outer membrane lipoprotein-sorting protein [Candidatus Thiodiazotropha taylori]